MDKIFKIGDIVILNRKEILKWNFNRLPTWYTTEKFKIVNFEKDKINIVILNKKLPSIFNRPKKILNIFVEKSITEERKEKLNNIKWN
jgi:hypothetical protein